MTTPELTTEQKLAAVMAAQVKGGCRAFEGCVPEDVVGHAVYFEGAPDDAPPVPLSNILIDQDLLRAAYGDKMIPYGVSFHRPGELQKDAAFTLGPDADSFLGRRIPDSDGAWTETPEWLAAAQDILHAWLDGGAVKAIDAAYSLLPSR